MAFDAEELNRRRQERLRQRQLRQKRSRIVKIVLIVLAALLILGVGALLIVKGLIRLPKPDTTKPSQTVPTSTTAPTEPQPTEPDRVIHLVAGGDINITDKTVAAGASAMGYDYGDVFLDILPILANGDLTMVNFEGNVVGSPYGGQTHSAPEQMLTALKNAGVDYLQAANSMSIFNGINGLRSTLQAIRSAGLEPLGAYSSAAEFRESGGYVLRNVGGIKVALVAFTKGMDGMGLPEGNEDCVNLLYKDYNSAYQKVDEAGINSILSAVNAQEPDVVIALLHWGSEFNSKVSKTQEKIRDLMLAAGVNAIIGTHSHYVQEVTFDAQAGTLVAYGLGDLLGDAEAPGTDYSVLLDLEITKSGTTGQTKVTGYEYTPLYLNTEGPERILRIRPAVAAYEGSAIGKVSPEVYAAMKSALMKIEGRMQ